MAVAALFRGTRDEQVQLSSSQVLVQPYGHSATEITFDACGDLEYTLVPTLQSVLAPVLSSPCMNGVVCTCGEDVHGKYAAVEGGGPADIDGLPACVLSVLMQAPGPRAAGARLAWFQIEDGRVMDFLRLAAGGDRAAATQALTVKPAADGLHIDGAMEVVVRSAADMHKLIASVRQRKIGLREDGQPEPGATCVYRLAPLGDADDQAAPAPGLCTWVVTLANASAAPSSAPGTVAPWVHALQVQLAGIEAGSAAPVSSDPVTAVLRPALLAAQPSAWLAVADAQPEANMMALLATLRFAARLRAIVARAQTQPAASAAPRRHSVPADTARPSAVPSLPSPQQDSDNDAADAIELSESDEDVHGPAGGHHAAAVAAPGRASGPAPVQVAASRPHSSGASASAPAPHEPERAPVASSAAAAAPATAAGPLIPPNASASDVADIMRQHAQDGDTTARWFVALLNSLETSRQQLDAAEARAQAAEASASAGPSPSSDSAHKHEVKRLRAALKKRTQEVRDYELYRDVMENTLVRLKDEVAKLVADRDAAKKSAKQAMNATRRQRELVSQARQEAEQAKADLAVSQANGAALTREALQYKRQLGALKKSLQQEHNESVLAAARAGSVSTELPASVLANSGLWDRSSLVAPPAPAVVPPPPPGATPQHSPAR